MTRRLALAAASVLATCAGPDVPSAVVPARAPRDAALAAILDAQPDAQPDAETTTAIAAPEPPDAALPAAPELWLKGSTHVHARPSGDSSEPIPDVIRWYEEHHYDFIVLTDHNKVSELDSTSHTEGSVALRDPAHGLIVLAGIELTHNPSDCIPPGDPSRKCRIHVNLVGATGRPIGKVVWADRHTHDRLAKYDAALVAQRTLGGLAQLNHPQWYWGMTGALLTELARRGFSLVEIWNAQFTTWSKGDATHDSMETEWDEALRAGVTLWGVASDDAHDYHGAHGKYPAGGGWVVVKARRDPQAIVAALAAGHFYASNGVTLEHAEVDAGELDVEVAAGETGTYVIEFIENGKHVERVAGRKARRAVPTSGYVRAVVTRDDGKLAWVQPARP